jgi:hypothetical protein
MDGPLSLGLRWHRSSNRRGSWNGVVIAKADVPVPSLPSYPSCEHQVSRVVRAGDVYTQCGIPFRACGVER